MLEINKKNIILIYFQIKNTFKNKNIFGKNLFKTKVKEERLV
jgi:hypothetical protein